MSKPIVAIIGRPNVGKSTLINKFVGKALAKTGDKAGVTRGKQWVRVKRDFELLDTPGILWPKFEDQRVGERLAFTGAINDDILDSETLACKLIDYLRKLYPLPAFLIYILLVQIQHIGCPNHDFISMFHNGIPYS